MMRYLTLAVAFAFGFATTACAGTFKLPVKHEKFLISVSQLSKEYGLVLIRYHNSRSAGPEPFKNL